ncbi:MAG: hypothetical protein HC837_02505 [Chloroflexaceae bacterium]|nr:hypothetical protein [Chloroflexaceae bacterium]
MRYIVLRILQVVSIVLLFNAVVLFVIMQPIQCDPDCSGQIMTNRNLSGFDLSDAIMVDADLRGSNLSNADLRGADLSGANLSQTALNKADLTGAKLIGADLRDADLRNTILDDADFRGANLTRVNLTRTNLTKVHLQGAILEQSRLIEVQLAGIDLAGVNMRQADLTGSNLDETILDGAFMGRVNFSGASLKNASLSGAFLNLSNLTGANLSSASLDGSSLIGTNLSSANLQNSTLIGATAVGTNFNGADLSNANLTGISLFQYELEDRKVTIDPSLAELNEFQRSQVIVDANLQGVVFDANTIWPAGKLALLLNILGSDFEQTQQDASISAALGQPTPSPVPAVTPDQTVDATPTISPDELEGDIATAGSSTLFNITNGIANEFAEQGFADTITIENAPAEQAFSRLCPFHTEQEDIIDIATSVRLLSDAERAICATNNYNPINFRIGTDAIAIIVNISNEFAKDVTLEDLKKMFTVERWSDVKPDWPAEPIVRYIPTADSDTFLLFAETVLQNVDLGSSSEDSGPLGDVTNVITLDSEDKIVRAIANDPFGVGFVQIDSFQQNNATLRMLPINGVQLSIDTVNNDTYPLKRPLLLYTDPRILQQKPQVAGFLDFYLLNAAPVVEALGFFPSSTAVISDALTRLAEASTVVEGGSVATTNEEEELFSLFALPDPLIPAPIISPTVTVTPTGGPAPIAGPTTVAGSTPTDGPTPTAVLTPTATPEPITPARLTGNILVAGNAPVISPTQMMANGFQHVGFTNAITITSVGNDQSFILLCETGQIDIANVDRIIADDESTLCDDIDRTPVVLRVGSDVLAITINPNNDFVQDVTLEELAQLFTVERWSDVNPDWPNQPIQRFLPPSTSSAFDLFVEEVLNDEPFALLQAQNTIITSNSDGRARGINTNPYAIGFFEYPVYEHNAGLLNLVMVEGIELDARTLANEKWPLMKPVLLYSAENIIQNKPQLAAFLNFYLTNANLVMDELNYVPASAQDLDEARLTLRQAISKPPETRRRR